MSTRILMKRAATMVRAMTDARPEAKVLRPEIPQSVIRPLSDFEQEALLQGNNACLGEYLRIHGLMIWQTREAFVSLFATCEGFDADYFRICCLPLAHDLPIKPCSFCHQDRNHCSARLHVGCCKRNSLGTDTVSELQKDRHRKA